MGKMVIYLRNGTGDTGDLHAQEVRIRERLDELGIEHDEAVVVQDVAPGSDNSRQGFGQLLNWSAAQGGVDVLAVDDLSRLHRSFVGAIALVQRIEHRGGRVVVVHEGMGKTGDMPVGQQPEVLVYTRCSTAS